MSREDIMEFGAASAALGRGITALLIASAEDSWLLPDDPFHNAGLKVLRATGLADAKALCDLHQPGVVFMPLTVDGGLTGDQLAQCFASNPMAVVVVIASNDQINTAADAMRAGAFDCLFRPFSLGRLAKTIDSALQSLPAVQPAPAAPAQAKTAGSEPVRAEDRPGPGHAPGAGLRANLLAHGIITQAPEMHALLERAEAVAASDVPVFIAGEVGSGKSLLAKAIHASSPRAAAPFTTLECATLTPARVEEDLLGSDGTAALSAGGTLFLNDLCDLDSAVQPQLLRLIEASIGTEGAGPHRIVSASRHDPRAAVEAGTLRADFYYRLHVAPLAVPPLRARRDDIALIAKAKLAQFAQAEGREFSGFSDATLALLNSYDWPGNVRELLNVIRAIVLLHDGPLVVPGHLPPELTQPAPHLHENARSSTTSIAEIDGLIGHSLREIEQRVIEATIRAEGGSVPRAARVLEVSPSTLYRKREGWTKPDKG